MEHFPVFLYIGYYLAICRKACPWGLEPSLRPNIKCAPFNLPGTCESFLCQVSGCCQEAPSVCHSQSNTDILGIRRDREKWLKKKTLILNEWSLAWAGHTFNWLPKPFSQTALQPAGYLRWLNSLFQASLPSVFSDSSIISWSVNVMTFILKSQMNIQKWYWVC